MPMSVSTVETHAEAAWQAFTVATSFSCDRPAAHDAHGVVASVAYCPLPQDEQACTVAEACGWY